MKKQYGEVIPGLKIHGEDAPYGVVNEREIRAAAGTMFLFGILVFFYTLWSRDFTLMMILIPVFWLEFFLKTVFQPSYSLFGIFGRVFTSNQEPEYVGAIQKRFAWGIGLLLATIMVVGAVLGGVRGMLPFSICTLCLFLMWLESTMGICLGCKMYGMLIHLGWLKRPEIQPACPGGVCRLDAKR
ncbi:DUF4395 family protein [Candidatus Uhrbacteria bacterium]|nr:DUF4395 family protein [Candidatus Uhrbacteria bacterium]